MRRSLTLKPSADLRPQSAIKTKIGRMKTHASNRSPLKDTPGDAVFAMLRACGHTTLEILGFSARITTAILTAGNVRRWGQRLRRSA